MMASTMAIRRSCRAQLVQGLCRQKVAVEIPKVAALMLTMSRNPVQRSSWSERCFASHGRGDVADNKDAITETEFHSRADTTLQHMFDCIDNADLDAIDDIHLEDGVLKLDLEGGAAFVINKHFVTRQIWYASPVSGALYFSPKSDGRWYSTEKEGDLADVFLEDFVKLCGEDPNFDATSLRG
eukprot:TRINITY_DN6011_c5_g1_i1.p1 TRINITY_DN6011_c5_g1~~TRINITY_DN6011_c5_g1_i1.p1  ORF type:complete len:183 (+),score=36.53 TRINITY_DN6011_c5_g1_i1:63-611(+)